MLGRSKNLVTVLVLTVLLSAAAASSACVALSAVNPTTGINQSVGQAADPTLQCAGPSGNLTQTFSTNETVYVQGYGFSASTNFTVYIIPNQFNTALADNFSLPNGATSYVTTVVTTTAGNISTTPIWVNVGSGDAGNYTVVCDVTQTTYYNSAVDPTAPITIISTAPTPTPTPTPTATPSPAPSATIPEVSTPILVLAISAVAACLYLVKRKNRVAKE